MWVLVADMEGQLNWHLGEVHGSIGGETLLTFAEGFNNVLPGVMASHNLNSYEYAPKW